ncbi:hypothetical protein MMG03_000465 [Fibrobacter succinogenes]|nr:DUF4157 domain-containing protein [Fibrobacter succinogenes]MCL4100896.1 hypothetical protein [Fibrobacter succinogenes]
MQTSYAQKNETIQKASANTADSVVDSSSQSATLQRHASLANAAVQRAENPPRPNNTGLPDDLKNGVESLSGYSLDNVRVHYNSPKPATVQALAYTQGTDIHVAPGQEHTLPHEAWHVTQQMAGRVTPTTNIGGMPVNDNAALEHEADVMGEKAVTQRMVGAKQVLPVSNTCFILQRKLIYQGKALDSSGLKDLEKKRVSHPNSSIDCYSDQNGIVYKPVEVDGGYENGIFIGNVPYYVGSFNNIVDAVVRISKQINLKYNYSAEKLAKMALYYIYEGELEFNDRKLDSKFDEEFITLLKGRIDAAINPTDSFADFDEMYRDKKDNPLINCSGKNGYYYVYRTMTYEELQNKALLKRTGRAGDFAQACTYSGFLVKFKVNSNGETCNAKRPNKNPDTAPIKSEKRGENLLPKTAKQFSFYAKLLWDDVESGKAEIVEIMNLGKRPV